MKSSIRNLSPPAEFCVVMLIAFGLPLTGSILVMARRLMNVEARPVHFDNQFVVSLLLTELIILTAVFAIGRIRGWASEIFRFRVSWNWTVVGVLLYGAATILAILGHKYALASGIRIEAHPPAGGLTLPFIILNSVTNPVFEETLEAGYVISSLHKFGMWPAILAGAFLRSILHVYLGVTGALVVLATGVLFGLVYWRWRQLWPLIVAHALLDLLGLMHVNIMGLLHLT